MDRPFIQRTLFTLLLFTVLVIGVSNGQRFGKKTTTTTTIAPLPPPLPHINDGNVAQIVPISILNAPSPGCPVGQRKDSRGRCRTVLQ